MEIDPNTIALKNWPPTIYVKKWQQNNHYPIDKYALNENGTLDWFSLKEKGFVKHGLTRTMEDILLWIKNGGHILSTEEMIDTHNYNLN